MKKIYRPFLKGTNWALAGLLSLLGFGSCAKDTDDRDLILEYGVPYTTYKISGKVLNQQGHPVQGIQIEGLPNQPVGNIEKGLSTSAGDYTTTLQGASGEKQLRLVVSDTDVQAHGAYQRDTIDITINPNDIQEPGQGWHQGTVTKTVNLVVKEQK